MLGSLACVILQIFMVDFFNHVRPFPVTGAIKLSLCRNVAHGARLQILMFFLLIFPGVVHFNVLGLTGNPVAASDAIPEGCEDLIDINLPENPKHADFVIQIQYSDRLICLTRSDAVYRAFLRRIGLDRQYRLEGLTGLAKKNENSLADEWILAVKRLDSEGVQLDPRQNNQPASDREWDSILEDYRAIFPQHELNPTQRAEIGKALKGLYRDGEQKSVRRLALATLAGLDGKLGRAWELANGPGGDVADIFAAGKWLNSANLKQDLFMRGREIFRNSVAGQDYLRFLAVVPGHGPEILQLLTTALETPHQAEAIGSLLARDISQFNHDSAESLADRLMAIYNKLPAQQRTKSKGKQIAKLLSMLAEIVSDKKKLVIQARLEGLEVAEITVTAMREQMAFDKDVLVLQAGQPVEITFRNEDNMPHNLVLVSPGAMETVGIAADQLAVRQGAGERQYVPDNEEVLQHTGMVESGGTESIAFIAPVEEGVYPLLCTFPGHWLKMFAAVVVTRDPKEFMASQDGVPSKETLLGIRNYEHQFNALAEQLLASNEPRSFDRGRAAFYSRACISCHMIEGKGGRVGPELSKIAENQKPTEILRSIMYPSEKIDPKFAKAEVEHLESGKIHAGVLVPQDDPEIIYLVEDPLAECEPQIFQRSEVEIIPLKISPMPEGLLRRSSPTEVLDLVAYLVSGGNPAHQIFTTAKSDR